MKQVSDFLAIGRPDQYKRADREAFLFFFINWVNDRYVPDEDAGTDGKELKTEGYIRHKWTHVEKCRIRNAIVREAKRYAKEHNVSEYDPQVLAKVFFENTIYGKNYQNEHYWEKKDESGHVKSSGMKRYVDDWGPKSSLIKTVYDRLGLWHKGSYCLISPYDPQYSSSDAFADEDAYNHFGIMHYDDATDMIDSIKLSPSAIIGIPGATIPSITSSSSVIVEGPMIRSGYAGLEHFITKKKNADDVRNYLLNIDAGQKHLTEEQKAFMREACAYVASLGVDYNLEVSGPELFIRLQGGIQIRLWHTNDDPIYQGRIYNNGVIVHVGLQNQLPANAVNTIVSNSDKINMLRWYFGTESVPISQRDTSGQVLDKDSVFIQGATMRYVGQSASLSKHGLGNTAAQKSGSYVTAYRNTSKRSEDSSVLLAYVAPKNDNQSANAVNIMYASTSSPNYVGSEVHFTRALHPLSISDIPNSDELDDGSANYTAWESFRSSVPVSQILAGDEETYMDDDGNEAVRIKQFVPASHASYYAHLTVRNALNDWVESAKENHRRLMDFEGLKASYDAWVLDNSYRLNGSTDDNIDELRTIYWKILTNKLTDEDISSYMTEEDIAELKGDTVEQKLAFIERHYQNYLAAEFGSVPELPADPGPVEVGFNPDNVARYSAVNASHSVQRNHAYIRHMLMSLDEYYDPSWVPYDNYVATQMRNDLVRFDGNPVASFKLPPVSSVGVLYAPSNGGVTAATQVFDSHGNIMPDAFDKIANVAFKGVKNDVGALKDKPVTFDMMMHTVRSLIESGCIPASIRVDVDANGVIRYSGQQLTGKYVKDNEKNSKLHTVSGEIGQVFEPDEYGVIHPNYIGADPEDRKVFVPGYNAYLMPNDPDDPKEMSERLRLIGWQQQMKQAITREIHEACFRDVTEYNFQPHGGCLNKVYKRMYDADMSERDYQRFLPKDPAHPTPEEQTFLNVIETLKGRCRFPNAYDDGATTMAQSYLENPERQESQNYDFYYSDLCDNHNLRVLGPFFDGIFDPDTTGTARTQGIVRYLAVGAKVNNVDGTVIPVDFDPSKDEVPKCALMMDELFKYKDLNSWDRRLMAASQVLTAQHTPRHVGVAAMTLDGWTFDDGFVVSKAFAEKYPVYSSATGAYRPLGIQDKLSDMNGNKGVISLVVDPDWLSENVEANLCESLFGDDFVYSMNHLLDILEDPDNEVDWDSLDMDESFLMRTEEGDDIEISFDRYDPAGSLTKQEYVAREFQNQMFMRSQSVSADNIYDGPLYINYQGTTYEVNFDPNDSRSLLYQCVYEIQKQNGMNDLDDVMRLFRDNPDLDAVVSPYSGMSRANAGMAAELLDDPADLSINGETVAGGMGHMNLIVVDMLADVKTHVYDEQSIREGKGRKASAQLAWALNSKGAYAIMNEFYGDNGRGVDDLREYAIAIGFDFDETLTPMIGYHPQEFRDEKRTLIKLPTIDDVVLHYSGDKKIKDGKLGNPSRSRYRFADVETGYGLTSQALSDQLVSALNQSGGFMELPFPLTFSSKDAVKGIPYFKKLPEDLFTLPQTGQMYVDVDGKEHPTYGLPVLSSSLRSGQEFQDGTMRPHEYTSAYLDIYRQGVFYMSAAAERKVLDSVMKDYNSCKNSEELYNKLKGRLDALGDKKTREACVLADILGLIPAYNTQSDLKTKKKSGQDNKLHEVWRDYADFKILLQARINTLAATQASCQSQAQARFDTVVNDIVEHRFSDKYNVIRESIMAKRLSNSGTFVWSADPRLKSDEVAMSLENAEKLGLVQDGKLKKDASVLLWRDPVLHDGNVRYMKVVINNNLIGCSINPIMDACFDGDFDGDSVAIVALQTDAARNQAYTAFSVESNVLNEGVRTTIVNPETGEEIDGHPLYIQTGQDRASNEVIRDIHGNVLFDSEGKPMPSDLKKYIDQLTWDINIFEKKVAAYERGESDGEDLRVKGQTSKGEVLKNVSASIRQVRKEHKARLDAWMQVALRGIGTDHLLLSDATALINSVQGVVDDGAKGNAKKMDGYLANCGLTYDRDSDGRPLTDTVEEHFDENGSRCSMFAVEGIQRDIDMRIQETAALKADDTQNGGMASQHGVTAFRDKAIHAVLEITYPVTQAILQSKHNPEEAKIKDKIVKFWGNDVWEGYKLTGDWSENATAEEINSRSHQRIVVRALDENGKPIPEREPDGNGKYCDKVRNGQKVYQTTYQKCTRDEWVAQMRGMYRALGVEDQINFDYVEELADIMASSGKFALKSSETGFTITKRDSQPVMSKEGLVCGIGEYIAAHGSLLDRMGYIGKFNAFVKVACNKTDEYVQLCKENGAEHLLMTDDNPACYSVFGNAYDVATEICDAEMNAVDDRIAAKQARADQYEVLNNPDATAADKKRANKNASAARARKQSAEGLIDDAKSKLSNSAMFAPNSYITESYGDAQRKQTGAKVITITKIKRGEKVVSTKNPTPIGRSDCRLKSDDYANGVAFMGESEADYRARLRKMELSGTDMDHSSEGPDMDAEAGAIAPSAEAPASEGEEIFGVA